MNRATRLSILLLACPAFSIAHAETYIGGGVGRAAAELGSFDESDSAYKLIAGYIFDLPAVDFSVEANYVDFGAPEDSGSGTELDITALDAFAVGGIDFGLVGLFGKAGVVTWEADALGPGFRGGNDGTDSAYGIGVRFNVRSLAARIEYERFDIDAVDDLDLFSASLIWRF